MTHPHDKIIRDWLDGMPTQYWDEARKLWIDLAPPDRVHKLPRFEPECQYRRKPINHRYRIGVLQSPVGERIACATDMVEESAVERLPYFIRWATLWIELKGE